MVLLFSLLIKTIQKRWSKDLSFNRGWDEYRDGFGDLNERSFWLGNEKVRQLTEDDDASWTISVHVFDSLGIQQAELHNFRLSGENYTIYVDDSMDCGDSK